MDSGLVVVVFIITSLIITVFSFLLFVDYEWCHVLFKNNTVSILQIQITSTGRNSIQELCSLSVSYQCHSVYTHLSYIKLQPIGS